MRRHILAVLAIAAAASVPFISGAAAGAAPGRAALLATHAMDAPAGAAATCVVHSLASFVAQGEGVLAATVADVVEVECNPIVYGTKSRIKLTASQLFSRCEGKLTWVLPNQPAEGELREGFRTATGSGVSLQLDADGNGTAALLAGPGCAAGESLITAHMEQEPFESFTTSFTVLPPATTPPGVYALPSGQVEDSFSSAVATIVQAEFPEGAEKLVRISSEELFDRCRVAPHLRWVHFGLGIGHPGVEVSEGSEIGGVRLDNDGNAFVVAIGDHSCAPGASLIEADLEAKPFTTYTTNFTILTPQPTAEPAFTIEKLQEIAGGGGGFTTAPLKGLLGQTVQYQIVVRNTGNVAETLGQLSDAHCDAGTITGGPPAGTLVPGEAATYTCSHGLSTVGPYVNEATVTATTVGGVPLTHTSNQVVVEVPAAPGFTVEKRQRLAGSGGAFTKSPVTGSLEQTVEYEITVTNTGNVALTLTSTVDPRCGTIAGGPGEAPLAPGASTTYTCSHVLTSVGTYVNEATVVGILPGGQPLAHNSNPVEAIVSQAPAKEFKPQTVGGGGHGRPPATNEVLPSPPRCTLPRPVLRGASGPKRSPFTLQMSSLGVKRLTFYLDGRKVRTLVKSQAKGGKFTISIDPRKLSYGKHNVLIKAIMTSPNCAAIARAGVFVHPKPFVVRFTG